MIRIAWTLCWAALAGFATAEKPNFLVILADDLGYQDVGFTGSKEIRTPRLDALAENGVVVRNGYVTHPYCGPSRAGLLTGRYQARFGMEINLTYSPYDQQSGLPHDEKTFGARLQSAGYRTGLIGKWHLGASEPHHPNQRGFDYFYGFLSGGHCYFPDCVTTYYPLQQPDGRTHYSANEGSFLPLTRNNQAADFDEYLTTALSRDAARFVGESDEPFCLYLAYNAPHAPYQAPKETIAKYSHIQGKNRRVYAAMIDEMDRGIGMVVDALKESGKLDNTVIFFLSDNGGVRVKEGQAPIANNAPFKGGKGSMHEGGSHVPFLVHWPAGLPKGQAYEGLVSSLDIAATAVALAGGDTSGHALEGVNLIPFLTGETPGTPHAALFWRRVDGAAWAVRTPTGKYLTENRENGVAKLYDMASDPYESLDLMGKAPELQAELARLWNDWNAQNVACRWLQANAYQRKRLQMYEELHEGLKEKAARRQPLVIE
ncbi:Arylsulfatase precursor [Planctomycetes bacterium MalM25]|nr:Arylsulfatase precursor [Planctomycetes bacterium MalM25]